MSRLHRSVALFLCAAVFTPSLPAAAAPSRGRFARARLTAAGKVPSAPQRFTLLDGRIVRVDRFGMAIVYNAKGHPMQTRWLPRNVLPSGSPGTPEYREGIYALTQELARPTHEQPYAPNRVVVVFRDGAAPSRDRMTVSRAALQSVRGRKRVQAAIPQYTGDSALNRVLADAGTSSVNRLFSSVGRGVLSSMHARARSVTKSANLNIANAYELTVASGAIEPLIAKLRANRGVAYVSPDWYVSPASAHPLPMPRSEREQLQRIDPVKARSAAHLRATGSTSVVDPLAVPSNFSIAASAQSFMDASGIDATTAYQEIVQRYHELPGTGEIVTNVSVGNIAAKEDATGVDSPQNLCVIAVGGSEGPTTQMIGGQRYLNWPGLPLIPAYAADRSGHIDPSYSSCQEGGVDEIGLDFSLMAPLPDERQRADARSSRMLGDLLGIAPGATYRLVVPADNLGNDGPVLSGIDGALLAAANQVPAPTVISASLGEGYDVYGFPGRYLEDDPLSQALISTIVNTMNIVVCISSGDGTRTYTGAAIGPSGGSAATELAGDAGLVTSLNDVALTTAASYDLDSGAISVGGTTTNDIFSAPPNDPQYAAFANQLAFPETRYNGEQLISSGFGSRVNISAPADNVLGMTKVDIPYNAVGTYNESGTSASAPEVAASAAVVRQVARLTGHPFTSARAVRDFLVATASAVAQPAQTDQALNVGPQLNLRRAVEKLLANAGITIAPRIQRIAIAQRRNIAPSLDTEFFTATDPAHVHLDSAYGYPDGTGYTDWITIAPDWQGVPDDAHFSLYVAGHPDHVLATSRFARVLPQQLMDANGCPVPSQGCTVHLVYRAGAGHHQLAQASFEIALGPTDGTSDVAFAPSVPAVVRGSSFTVSYDLTKVRGMNHPMLAVTEPGRFSPNFPGAAHAAYLVPLPASSGTVSVPASVLQGGGLYGVGIVSYDPTTGAALAFSDFAITRFEQGSAKRAAAPLVQVPGSPAAFAHSAEVPYGGSVAVSWDASNVPNANGALLEVSAPGPSLFQWYNTFNNPNGTVPDNNGFDTGSVVTIPLTGARGQTTFKASDLGLKTSMIHSVRIIPTNGGTAVGEASDSAAITLDGITPGLVGLLDHSFNLYSGGFGIDPDGNDGFLIANQLFGGAIFGSWMQSSLERFDQTTGKTSEVAAGIDTAGWGLNGGGFFANDSAFFSEWPTQYTDIASRSLYFSPLSGGTGSLQQMASLPSGSDAVFQVSHNPGSSKAAVLFFDGAQALSDQSPAPLQLTTIDFSTGSTGPVLSTPLNAQENLQFNFNPTLFLFNADMTLNKAVAIWEPSDDFSGATVPKVDIYNLNGGGGCRGCPPPVTEFDSIAKGVTEALAVDETTHLALSNSVADVGLVILNLQTGAQTPVPLAHSQDWQDAGLGGVWSGVTPEYITADPVNHLFLVYSPWGPGLLNGDYNSTAALYVYDEQGNLQKTVTGWVGHSETELFQLGNNKYDYLQANGHTRKAYLMSHGQIAVIDY